MVVKFLIEKIIVICILTATFEYSWESIDMYFLWLKQWFLLFKGIGLIISWYLIDKGMLLLLFGIPIGETQ
jgi:hypothetical protein